MSKINLDNYIGWNKVLDLKAEIIKILGDKIFTCTSFQELYYFALKKVDLTSRTVRNTTKSIQNHLTKFLKHIKIHDVSVRKREIILNNPKDSNSTFEMEWFKYWFLSLTELPSKHLRELRPKVEKDLKDINSLIKEYEETNTIQRYKSKREIPRNHKAKTILDFYDRCLNERQIILNYFLEGIYDRALIKCHPFAYSELFTHYQDFPYQFGKNNLGLQFDYKKIDCISHRIGHILMKDYYKYTQLYKENKEKFYRILFKARSKEKIFENIEFDLERV